MLKFLLICIAVGGALGSPLSDRKERIQKFKENQVNNEVCYDGYGCFSSEAPWTSGLRPLVALPMRPEEIGTRHLLFTRNSRYEAEELLVGKDAMLEFSQFDGSRRTVFIIHGWTDSSETQWVNDTKNALLDKEDLNVMVTDWSPGAKKSYIKAVGNTRLVGAQVSMFVDFILEKTAVTTDRIHLIGHSLGSHVAGYIGSRIPGIARITALDPTQPYFEGTDKMVRIDEDDATFVEGIHTNANAAISLGLGMTTPIGDIDIYPNGGETQPGCKDLLGNLVTSIIDLIILDFDGAISTYACSHARATEYWAESLKTQCPYIAYKCDDYKQFQKGTCYQPCQESESGCIVVGYENERFISTATKGKYFLHTDSASSYCLQSAHLDSHVNAAQTKIDHGRITIEIRRPDGVKSEKYILAEGAIQPDTALGAYVEVPSAFLPSLEDKLQLVFHYTRTGVTPGLDPKILILDNLTINFLDQSFGITTKTFSGVTLEAGTDLIISE